MMRHIARHVGRQIARQMGWQIGWQIGRRTLAGAAMAGLLVGALAAHAGPKGGGFVPTGSNFRFVIGGLPPINFPAAKGTEDLANLDSLGAQVNSLTMQRSIWQTTDYSAGTSLFTGVPSITDIVITGPIGTVMETTMTPGGGTETVTLMRPVPPFRNGPGTFLPGFSPATVPPPTAMWQPGGLIYPEGGLGAQAPLEGVGRVLVLNGAFVLPVDLAVFGGTTLGTFLTNGLLGQPITVLGGPWVTGTALISGITSNVIEVIDRPGDPPANRGVAFTLNPTTLEEVWTYTTMGGFVQTVTGMFLRETQMTVTVAGSNDFDEQLGKHFLTLVTPAKVNVASLGIGIVPIAAYESFEFDVVPEPSTLLLAGASVACFVVLGVRRWRST